MLLTFLKYFRVSGLRSHISVTRQTAVRRTPLFFSLRRARVQGMNISMSSGTLRIIRKAHSAAFEERKNKRREVRLVGVAIDRQSGWI